MEKTDKLLQVSLHEKDWDIIAQALDLVVKTNGIQGSKIVTPIFDTIAEQLKNQNVFN